MDPGADLEMGCMTPSPPHEVNSPREDADWRQPDAYASPLSPSGGDVGGLQERTRRKNTRRRETGRTLVAAEHEAPETAAVPDPVPATTKPRRTRPLTSEWEQKYPPDEQGEELGEGARVWKIYLDDAAELDAKNLECWNSSLDVLLIFAGLFSGVSTAFILQAYQSLQPNYTQLTFGLLLALAQNNGSISLSQIPSLSSQIVPSSARWVNGLWFTSLVTSLCAALVCILAKQWLAEYLPRQSGSFADRARQRQFRYASLTGWHVPALIAMLPFLLQSSLFLFFIGLGLFIWPQDLGTGIVVTIIVFCAGAFYAVSTCMPAFRLDCPFRTPLLVQLLRCTGHLSHLFRRQAEALLSVRRSMVAWYRLHVGREHNTASRAIDDTTSSSTLIALLAPLEESEKALIGEQAPELEAALLMTMLAAPPKTDRYESSLDAIGVARARSPIVTLLVKRGLLRKIVHDLHQSFPEHNRLELIAPGNDIFWLAKYLRVLAAQDLKGQWTALTARSYLGFRLTHSELPDHPAMVDIGPIAACYQYNTIAYAPREATQVLTTLIKRFSGSITYSQHTILTVVDFMAFPLFTTSIDQHMARTVLARCFHSNRAAVMLDLPQFLRAFVTWMPPQQLPEWCTLRMDEFQMRPWESSYLLAYTIELWAWFVKDSIQRGESAAFIADSLSDLAFLAAARPADEELAPNEHEHLLALLASDGWVHACGWTMADFNAVLGKCQFVRRSLDSRITTTTVYIKAGQDAPLAAVRVAGLANLAKLKWGAADAASAHEYLTRLARCALICAMPVTRGFLGLDGGADLLALALAPLNDRTWDRTYVGHVLDALLLQLAAQQAAHADDVEAQLDVVFANRPMAAILAGELEAHHLLLLFTSAIVALRLRPRDAEWPALIAEMDRARTRTKDPPTTAAAARKHKVYTRMQAAWDALYTEWEACRHRIDT